MPNNLSSKVAKVGAAQPEARTASTLSSAADQRNRNRTTIYLSEDVRRGLRIHAIEKKTTMNDLIVAAIMEYASTRPELSNLFTQK